MRSITSTTIFYLALLISTVMLAGCRLDGEDSLELKRDGSATISLNYEFPNRVFSIQEGAMILDFLEEVADRHDELTLVKGEVTPSGRQARRIMIELSVDNVIELEGILEEELEGSDLDPEGSSKIAGKLKAIIGDISTEIDGTSIQYRREINLNPMLSTQVNNADLLGKFEFRYSITVPSAPTSHNATSTSNNGRTLTWVLPLKEYYDKPFVMEATIPALVFIPWWIWAVAVLILLILIAVAYKLCRMMFKKKAQA